MSISLRRCDCTRLLSVESYPAESILQANALLTLPSWICCRPRTEGESPERLHAHHGAGRIQVCARSAVIFPLGGEVRSMPRVGLLSTWKPVLILERPGPARVDRDLKSQCHIPPTLPPHLPLVPDPRASIITMTIAVPANSPLSNSTAVTPSSSSLAARSG